MNLYPASGGQQEEVIWRNALKPSNAWRVPDRLSLQEVLDID